MPFPRPHPPKEGVVWERDYPVAPSSAVRKNGWSWPPCQPAESAKTIIDILLCALIIIAFRENRDQPPLDIDHGRARFCDGHLTSAISTFRSVKISFAKTQR